jgi:hypothetical protein
LAIGSVSKNLNEDPGSQSQIRHDTNTPNPAIKAGDWIGFAAPTLIAFGDRDTLVSLSLVVGPAAYWSKSVTTQIHQTPP